VTRRVTLVLLALVIVAMVAAGGCSAQRGTGSEIGTEATGTSSLTTTSTVVGPALVETPTAGTASSGGSDVKAIDAELNAMQKELDAMSMPADSDFAPVEGALY